ncbi:MAG TPA: hypothetical protein VLG38_05655 [Gammaproteobacteria bacterium]|nr:hypothetical protein [Gammaproteobacteria bacterium]
MQFDEATLLFRATEGAKNAQAESRVLAEKAAKRRISAKLRGTALNACASEITVELDHWNNGLKSYVINNQKVEIIASLGAGVAGSTFLARDGTGKMFVVKAATVIFDKKTVSGGKLFKPALFWNRKILARAIRESGNICKNGLESQVLIDAEQGHVFVTMPFYPGVSVKARLAAIQQEIKDKINSNNKLEAMRLFREMFEILLQVLTILQKFHQKTGLVHGDAWLDNFMINDAGIINMIDYGSCCQQGINSDMYFAQELPLSGGDYHTAPEMPCKATQETLSAEYIMNKICSKIRSEGSKLEKLLKAERPLQDADKHASANTVRVARPEIDMNTEIVELNTTLAQLEKAKNTIMVKARAAEEANAKKGIQTTADEVCIFRDWREYSGTISEKTDLHAVMASYLFEAIMPLVSEDTTWPTDANEVGSGEFATLIFDTMRWCTLNACNSDWFFAKMQMSENVNFIDKIKAERDRIMLEKGFTTSEQARANVAEAIAMIEGLINRITAKESDLSKIQLQVAA